MLTTQHIVLDRENGIYYSTKWSLCEIIDYHPKSIFRCIYTTVM